jgi:hypothetical protein
MWALGEESCTAILSRGVWILELERREDGWFAVLNGQVICHVK